MCDTQKKYTALMFQESTCEFKEDSQKLWPQNTMMETDPSQYTSECPMRKREFREHSRKLTDQQWCEISEVIESDFLISPGDIYLELSGTGRCRHQELY